MPPVNAKDPCPCGSGKRYKHCHGPADRARRQRMLAGLLGAATVLLLGAVGFTALRARQAANAKAARPGPASARPAASEAASASPGAPAAVGDSGRLVLGEQGPGGLVRAPLPDPNALSLRPPNSGEVAPGEHPRPWEYDVAHNRYYDPRPGHMHWHSGQPPADTTSLGQAPVVIVTTPASPAPSRAPKPAVKR